MVDLGLGTGDRAGLSNVLLNFMLRPVQLAPDRLSLLFTLVRHVRVPSPEVFRHVSTRKKQR